MESATPDGGTSATSRNIISPACRDGSVQEMDICMTPWALQLCATEAGVKLGIAPTGCAATIGVNVNAATVKSARIGKTFARIGSSETRVSRQYKHDKES